MFSNIDITPTPYSSNLLKRNVCDQNISHKKTFKLVNPKPMAQDNYRFLKSRKVMQIFT